MRIFFPPRFPAKLHIDVSQSQFSFSTPQFTTRCGNRLKINIIFYSHSTLLSHPANGTNEPSKRLWHIASPKTYECPPHTNDRSRTDFANELRCSQIFRRDSGRFSIDNVLRKCLILYLGVSSCGVKSNNSYTPALSYQCRINPQRDNSLTL